MGKWTRRGVITAGVVAGGALVASSGVEHRDASKTALGARLALLWMLNLYNFMDGIDGIAALQCIQAAFSAALLSWFFAADADYALYCLLLAAAHAGFPRDPVGVDSEQLDSLLCDLLLELLRQLVPDRVRLVGAVE